MSKRPLSEKQQSVYNFLVKEMSSGFPPTVREICKATGIKSTSTVHAVLGVLEENGYIVRDAKNSRAIRLGTDFESAMVPLVGRITAGKPILAVEEIEDYIPYPSRDAEGLFALKVVGLSMRDAGILDGDIIVADSMVDTIDTLPDKSLWDTLAELMREDGLTASVGYDEILISW